MLVSSYPLFRILCWWGIWLITLSATSGTSGGPRSAQLGALASPLFTMVLLIFGSGMYALLLFHFQHILTPHVAQLLKNLLPKSSTYFLTGLMPLTRMHGRIINDI